MYSFFFSIKIQAIFGFCDIRNFTDCCEVLREAVMIFTNQIARIVHSSVHASGGDVNKNIGDAFLAVWKLSEEELPNVERKLSPMPLHEEKTTTAASTTTLVTGGSHSNRKMVRTFPKLTVHTAVQHSPSSSTSGNLGGDGGGGGDGGDSGGDGGGGGGRNNNHQKLGSTQYLLPSVPSTQQKRRGSMYVHHLTNDATVSDKALKSFLDIITLLDRSPAVQMYAKSSALQAKLPGFRVRMGFGLHLGWGIEVSVGGFGKLRCE